MSKKNKIGLAVFSLSIFIFAAVNSFLYSRNQGLTIEDIFAQIMQDIFRTIVLLVMLFGAFMLMRFLVWFNETSEKEKKNNRYEPDYHIDWKKVSKRIDLETELRIKISEMEIERSRLHTGGIFDFGSSDLSQEELDRNRKRWRYLSDKIREYMSKLNELD